jgi:hypothetical protein
MSSAGRWHECAFFLAVVAGCTAEPPPGSTPAVQRKSPYQECKQYDFVVKSCASDPLKAICSAQFGYDKEICKATDASAAKRNEWCLVNTPSSWLGSACPSYVCILLLESTDRLCAN